jgi:hypothetical protein
MAQATRLRHIVGWVPRILGIQSFLVAFATILQQQKIFTAIGQAARLAL